MPLKVLISNKTGNPEDPATLKATAFNVLLPLARRPRMGGPEAHSIVGKLLLQALQPFRRAGAAQKEPEECFSLMRCTSYGKECAPATKQLHACSWCLSLAG